MAYKCALVLFACCIAFAAATPLNSYHLLEEDDQLRSYGDAPLAPETLLVRHVRSPEGGSLDLKYIQDQAGKSAQVQYNQNLHTSADGRFKVDAYAQGTRDITRNRNDYGGGIQSSWSF